MIFEFKHNIAIMVNIFANLEQNQRPKYLVLITFCEASNSPVVPSLLTADFPPNIYGSWSHGPVFTT